MSNGGVVLPVRGVSRNQGPINSAPGDDQGENKDKASPAVSGLFSPVVIAAIRKNREPGCWAEGRKEKRGEQSQEQKTGLLSK